MPRPRAAPRHRRPPPDARAARRAANHLCLKARQTHEGGSHQMASTQLQGQTVAFLTAQEGVEEVELTEPWKAVQEAGATPNLIAPQSGQGQTVNPLDKSRGDPVDVALEDADADNYDVLWRPGGVANPEQRRSDELAIQFAQKIFS